MRMKICLLSRCLGPTFVFCIFLSNQQEKSLFSDSADPSIFSDKMAVTSVLLYLLLLYSQAFLSLTGMYVLAACIKAVIDKVKQM